MKCQSNIELGYYDLWRLGEKALIDVILLKKTIQTDV